MKTPFIWLTVAGLLLGVVGCATVSEPKLGETRPVIASPAREILQRWIKAQGGAEALRSVKAIESKGSLTIGGAIKADTDFVRLADGRYRGQLVLADGKVFVEAFDGRIAWRANEQVGFGFVPRAEVALTLIRNDIAESLKVEQNYVSCVAGPDEKKEDRLCHCLVLRGRNGSVEKWYFDAESGQRVRIERSPSPADPQASVAEASDFRKVGKLVLPFTERSVIGALTFESKQVSVALNPKVDETGFSATPEQLSNGRKVEEAFARHLEGIGGMAAFMRLKSRVTHATLEIAGMKTTMVISQKLPSNVLVESDAPGMGHVVQGFDGKTAWVNSEIQGYRTLKGAELQQLLSNADLRVETQLAARYPLRKWIGEKVVNGHNTDVVELGNLFGRAGTYYFDHENGLVRRIETNLVAGAKGVLPVTMDFSDFRTIDGIALPFVTTTKNPAMTMVMTLQSVEDNVPLDDAIFTPRKD